MIYHMSLYNWNWLGLDWRKLSGETATLGYYKWYLRHLERTTFYILFSFKWMVMSVSNVIELYILSGSQTALHRTAAVINLWKKF